MVILRKKKMIFGVQKNSNENTLINLLPISNKILLMHFTFIYWILMINAW